MTREDKGRNIRKALLIEICGRVSKALVIEQVQREATNPYQAHGKRSRADRPRLWLRHRIPTISLWRLHGLNKADICMDTIEMFALTANVVSSVSWDALP